MKRSHLVANTVIVAKPLRWRQLCQQTKASSGTAVLPPGGLIKQQQPSSADSLGQIQSNLMVKSYNISEASIKMSLKPQTIKNTTLHFEQVTLLGFCKGCMLKYFFLVMLGEVLTNLLKHTAFILPFSLAVLQDW